ncbi:methyltransferase family protein [Pseudonocardia humida]|uniref:Isoprenylcysteine carboxylmethyltransferase family protein n=1 Tax=Pseudonocardia humida TaxID=2800819 RepID=A0ABT1ADX6_9PSEU|nr:isoprenylcysteine carboxylmethyltransferase family protein [Pseudonocardia humida]MCO1660814.1 isoprenylcysteine carboxylmethyltransferase family protein [Pseudonocardia humida]
MRNAVVGVVVLGGVLCLIAGTPAYWQGWVFAAVFAGLVAAQGAYLAIADPALLERRKPAARAASTTGQRIDIGAIYAIQLGLLVVCAFDRRFGWSAMPAWVPVLGIVSVVLANVLWYRSKRENTFAGAGIMVYEDQRVISTGPYAVVRHPNYGGDLLLVVGAPVALGSWWGLLPAALFLPALVWMIRAEERFLEGGLSGYRDYEMKVRFRLVPHLW